MLDDRESQRIRDAIMQATSLAAQTPTEMRSSVAGAVLAHLLRETSDSRGLTEATPRRPGPAPTTVDLFALMRGRPQTEQLLAMVAERYEDGEDVISVDRIREVYREARVPAPGNIFEVIRRCVTKGWIASTNDPEGRPALRVSQTGLKRARGWTLGSGSPEE